MIFLDQRPVVPGWKPTLARAVMRGLADRMLMLERVKVSLFMGLPVGGALGWPLNLYCSLCFRARSILKSTCLAIPAKCFLKEFEKASHSD